MPCLFCLDADEGVGSRGRRETLIVHQRRVRLVVQQHLETPATTSEIAMFLLHVGNEGEEAPGLRSG